MKILLTGASGFLGKSMLSSWSSQHEVITLGRDESNLIQIDLSREKPSLPTVDMVVHAAGKAHIVPKTDQEKQEFFEVNLQGTRHLLEAITELPRLFVFISTVAVYGLEEGNLISEEAPLNGTSPYAESKIQAEQYLIRWGQKMGVPVVILRLPLIVGPNPPGNLGAMIHAVRKGFYFRLGSGEARKSMVLAKDVADFIPSLLGHEGIFNLCDGAHPSLAELDQKIADHYGKKVRSISEKPLSYLAKIGDFLPFFPLNSYRLGKLAHTLTFDDQKARKELGWNPRYTLDNLFE